MESARSDDESALLRLAGLIYGAALDASRNTEAHAALAEVLRAAAIQTWTIDTVSGAVLQSTVWPENSALALALPAYLREQQDHDPRLPLIVRLGQEQVLCCHDRLDEAAVAASRFYQEHLLPLGLRWTLGALVTPGRHATALAALRPPGDGPFDPRARAVLGQLLPHLRQAARVRQELEAASAGDQAALDEQASALLHCLPLPCMLTDRAGRCLDRNGAFEQAMGTLGAQLALGRLRFADPRLQDGWATVLAKTEETALAHSVELAPLRGHAWQLHVTPLHAPGPAAGAPRKTLLAVLREASTAATGMEALMQRAALTRAELQVLAGLLQGLPAKAIASRRGSSVNTIRSQIVAILDKTGHHSQKQLLAAFGNSSFDPSLSDDSR